MKRTVFLYPEAVQTMDYPPECPFRIARVEKTYQQAKSLGLFVGGNRSVIHPRPASRKELERFHDPAYLDELERSSAGDLSEAGLHMGLGTPDNPIFPNLFNIASAAAGSGLHGAQCLLEDTSDRVFSPLGGYHHAMKAHAGGFCYVNDLVLAALRFADAGRRVLILDIDAHHGDGTQTAFYDRSDIFTISLHESGRTLFPETGFEDEIGSGQGLGFNANLCFPPDTYDAIYLEAFHAMVPALIASFDPDVIIMELGMDTLAGDPLTHLSLTNNAPAAIVRWVCDLNRPLLATGGGGYHIEHTVRAWTRMWEILCDDEQDPALAMAMGGTLLETTEWRGGLPDRELTVDDVTRQGVRPEVLASVEKLKHALAPFHKL